MCPNAFELQLPQCFSGAPAFASTDVPHSNSHQLFTQFPLCQMGSPTTWIYCLRFHLCNTIYCCWEEHIFQVNVLFLEHGPVSWEYAHHEQFQGRGVTCVAEGTMLQLAMPIRSVPTSTQLLWNHTSHYADLSPRPDHGRVHFRVFLEQIYMVLHKWTP